METFSGGVMERPRCDFADIEVNGGFEWAGLTFLKTSENHGLCLDDESKSMVFCGVATVIAVDGKIKPKETPVAEAPAEVVVEPAPAPVAVAEEVTVPTGTPAVTPEPETPAVVDPVPPVETPAPEPVAEVVPESVPAEAEATQEPEVKKGKKVTPVKVN